MGLIKRALKRTSRKLLAKFMAPAHTHQLVLNPPLQTGDISPVHLSSSQSRKMRKLSSLQRKFRKSSSSKDTAVAEALLLAVKNYLPPLQFHHIHGPHAQLSQNKCVARRTQSFCQALVFSNRVILPNERVYIKVLEISKCWSGTIRFGFTAVDPATLACKMPKHACPDMTNAGHTWARALADEVVRRNSVIHFSYNKHGIIHYGINNQDCGIFHANVGTNQNLWFIVDIYGLTAAVELIDPRVNKATTGELDFAAHIDAELAQANHHDRSSTMFKSTSAMDELFGRHHGSSAGNGGGLSSSSSRLRKKQSRKHARQLALIQGNWPLENYSAGANFHSLQLAQQQHQHQQQQLQHGAMQLPNLNSITLPSVEQNIYTPMPNPGVDPAAHQRHHRPDMHDYQQIMSNTYGSSGLYRAARAAKLTNSISMANLSHVPQSVYGTSANSSSTSATNRPGERSVASINQVDLSDQLEQMHLHDKRPRQHQQQSSPSMVASASKSSKSSSSVVTSQLPVAATRKRQQQINSVQTNLKRTPESARDRPDKAASAHRIVSSKSHASPAASSSSSSSLTTTTATATATTRQAATSSSYTGSGSQANVKPKTRHSIKNHKSISAKDSNNNNNNNNSPPSKDCPICFERPINCVLYQCGHMCTCYECGVKQWKTQSRTCPICRTIIKDVIKTYLS